MGVYRLQRVGSFTCLLLCLGVATGCAALGGMGSGPGLAQRTSGQGAAQTAFSDAERAYQQKDYPRARLLFQSFLANHPQSPLVEDGSFRLGEVLYYEGTFPDAQQNLQEFLAKFPRSKLAPDAAYLRSLSLLHLKRYTEARTVLEEAQGAYPNARLQAAFILTLAKVSVAEGQYIRALDELHRLTAARQIPAEVQQEARVLSIDIVSSKLTLAELETLKKRWPTEFPSDYILLRIAKEASNHGAAIQAEAAAKEFLANFPNHSEAPRMQALVTDLEQARTVSVDPSQDWGRVALVQPPASRMGQRGRTKRAARYPGCVCAGGI